MRDHLRMLLNLRIISLCMFIAHSLTCVISKHYFTRYAVDKLM